MDVWVVAAAAGAGFIVQRLKNLNFVRPEASSSKSDIPDNICPLRRVLLGRSFKNETPEEREKRGEVTFREDMDSTTVSESENMVMLMPDKLRSCSSVPDTNCLSGFLNHEDFEGEWDDRVPPDFEEVRTSDSLPQPSSKEVGVSYVFRRNKSSIRSKRTSIRLIKSQTSLESCVAAQLYKEQGETEELTYLHDQLNEPIVRPFVVSDGMRLISRLPNESFSPQTQTGKHKLLNDAYVMENKAVLGIPELPNVVIGESQGKAKARKGNVQVIRRNGSHEGGTNGLSRDGPPDKAFHFYNGLTMGIISSFLANKQEMEKLNKLLKQSENLVQDLHEELEMKDSLTVKELDTEHYESHHVPDDSCYYDDATHATSSNEREPDNSSASPDHINKEESLSRIEAELEAELERLESNLNSSRLEGKLSNVAELDPNFVTDVVEGELRADLFGAKNGKQTYADRDGSGTATPHSLPQPVSPRELTLRLHEVIQSRLEQRVKELELALENSQRKLKIVESSSSVHNSSTAKDRQDCYIIDQPVVINLSGEALSAYNEAYEELAKVSESDDEDMRLESEDNGSSVSRGDSKNAGRDQVSVLNVNQDNVTCPETEDYFHSMRLNDVVRSSMEESDDDGEDEMEKLLIRQIIEKAKQGSPAVLKAQRAFLWTLNEH